jgi:hypothetical protein
MSMMILIRAGFKIVRNEGILCAGLNGDAIADGASGLSED